MADSNITKKALAASLKELMTEQSFEKINVTQICERCDMNRKSFYYHFKDKYDLINWIFDTEFMALVKDEDLHADYGKHWALVEKACDYFYENHAFYRKSSIPRAKRRTMRISVYMSQNVTIDWKCRIFDQQRYSCPMTSFAVLLII